MSKQGLMVFYINVGNIPSHKAMAYLERVKKELLEQTKEDDSWELNDQYDCMFMARPGDISIGTTIKVYPYGN